MDKTGADFEYSVQSMINRLGVKATPIQYPIGAESDFVGNIDLIEMKAYYYDGKEEEKFEVRDIPENLKATAEL